MQVGTRAAQLDGSSTNNSIFVQYPTQTGAFWQWGGNSVATQRMPWHPTTPADTPSGWVNSNIPGNWYANATTPNLMTNHETCPPGFRRPRDGDPWNNVPNNTAALVQQSEIRQSLFLLPQIGSGTNNTANSVFGFYADGFFDRRLPTNATGGAAGRNVAGTVAAGTEQIANRGTLLFNGESGASLFFPATGHRSMTLSPNGVVTGVGNTGHYWSSTPHTGSAAWRPSFGNNNSNIGSGDRAHGFPIRCVVE